MESKKKLYPIEFIPAAVRKPWGGNSLIKKLGKEYSECDSDGNETRLTDKDLIGESLEIADLGFADSVIKNGWLAGNTIGEIMDTYIERISGEAVYRYYGRQFPVMVKLLDINGKTSVQVNPDDEAAGQRYDALGKSKMWYILDSSEQARIYLGFKEEISAQTLYEKCLDGTIVSQMNEIHPHKGDAVFFQPGTVHCAEGHMLVAEIQESSDLTFRLYDWGREDSEETARPMHLEEAFDLIDFGKCDTQVYIKKAAEGNIFTCREFRVNLMEIRQPLQIGHPGYFIVYVCTEGELSIQVHSGDDTDKKTDEYRLKKGESILIPADMSDFYLVPVDRDTTILEVMPGETDELDSYIDPNTEPYLEGEDYEGLEDGETDDEEE